MQIGSVKKGEALLNQVQINSQQGGLGLFGLNGPCTARVLLGATRWAKNREAAVRQQDVCWRGLSP